MSIRKFVVLAALAVFGVMAIGAASASATTTVLRTDPGGALLPAGSTIKNTSSDPAVLTTQAGTVTCNQTSVDGDVGATHGASSVSGTLTLLTFTSCTDTILAVNILDCTLHNGSPMPTVTIAANSTGTGGTVTLGDTVVRCATSPTQACYYTAGAPSGAAVNATSSIAFSNVVVTGVLPTTDAVPVANCGSSGQFSVTLTHIVTGTNATITVTTS